MKKIKILLVSLLCLLLVGCSGCFVGWEEADFITVESYHGVMYRNYFENVKYQKTTNGIIIKDEDGNIHEFINSNIKIIKKSGQ